MISADLIKQTAREVGFDLCGVVSAAPLLEAEGRFRRWLEAGNHSSLHYLERHLDKRFHPDRLVEGCRTVAVCAVAYRNRFRQAKGEAPGIASYALMTDYHQTIKEMLLALAERLRVTSPELRFRAFVDSAPLGEKPLAVRAGLGWQGRHSLLITPQWGSSVLLGELLLSEEADAYDTPFEGERCGSCRACIEACPNGAIGEDRTVDTRRCIACRTIERGEEPIDLSGWIFGCDRCQEVCPHNRLQGEGINPRFEGEIDPEAWPRERWLTLTEEEFNRHFGHTPLMRAGLKHLQSLLTEQDKEGGV